MEKLNQLTRRQFVSTAGALAGGALIPNLASGGAPSAQANGPKVFWVADPAGPGQTLLLFGAGLESATVSGARLADAPLDVPVSVQAEAESGEKLELAQANAECLKVAIPAGWRPGLYTLWVSGANEPIYANLAQVWWLLGERGRATAPGGELRLFGKNFLLQARERVWQGAVVVRDVQGKYHRAEVSDSSPYALTIRVPEEVAEGAAEVFVHNGFGGTHGWSAPLAFDAVRATPWPATVYNVRDMGAHGDALTDDTEALRAALAKCQDAGGGVVYLPRGVYRITGQLTVPRRTVLRGEKREVVWLYVPVKTPELKTVLAGAGEFGVEELSMTAQTPLRMITAPEVESMYTEYKPWGEPGTARADDIFLRRLRIHHLRYAHRVGEASDDPRRLEAAGPSTVALAGSRLKVSDCEIVSPGMPIIIHGTRHSRILSNDLRTGRSGWYGIWGAAETVFEGNTIQGQDLEGSYGGFANYGRGSGTDVARLYIAHNRFLAGYGCEREAITFDTPGRYPWTGQVRAADRISLSGADADWDEDFTGLACLIVAGKGVGQHRRITSNGRSCLVVDVPWNVVPDATSVASILPFRRDVVLYANHSQDASVGVQLWAGGYNFIIDDNTAVRTGGLWGTAAQYRDQQSHSSFFLPCYFTQWLGNEIRESFIYEQGPEEDNSATLGLYVRDAPVGANVGSLVVGNVIRGNRVSDNTRIGLFYYGAQARKAAQAIIGQRPPVGRDTIIEENSVCDSPVGVDLEPGFAHTLVRNNQFQGVRQHVRARQWD